MLRIDLAPLGEGVHTLALNPEAEAVGLDPDLFADLRVEATLDLFNDRILVTLQATATATLECDRTLARFEQPIAGTYRVLFVPPSFARREDDEAPYEEVRVLEDTERTLDLADAVRDTVLLAVPARKVAPGAEDIDIQTTFGAPDTGDEPAIDPRWEALRALQAGNDAD